MDSRRLRSLGRHSIRVELQPYRDRTDWVVTRRTWSGGEHHDSLLAHGSLRYTDGRLAPRDLTGDLRRISYELDRLYPGSRPGGAPEPPRGGYGGDQPLPGLDAPGWARSVGGTALDTCPAQR